jgi:hypothetical protein
MILVEFDHSNIFIAISEQDISIYFLRHSEDGLGARNSFSTVRNHLDFTERGNVSVISPWELYGSVLPKISILIFGRED